MKGMHKRLAELSAGSPDWTMPRSTGVKPTVGDVMEQRVPVTVTDHYLDIELQGTKRLAPWYSEDSGPQVSVQELVAMESPAHRTLMALCDLPQLHYRLLLWLWAGHRSDRDLNVLMSHLRPHVGRVLEKAGYHHKRRMVVNNYIALALMELGGIGDSKYAGRVACYACDGTGVVYSMERKQKEKCGVCDGDGVLAWSQTRRGMLLGISQRAWAKSHEDPYLLVLREVSVLDTEGRQMLWKAM